MKNEDGLIFTWHNVLVSATMVGETLASRVVFHVFASGDEAQMALTEEESLPLFPLRMQSDNEFLEMSGGFAAPFPFLAIYHPPGPVTPLSALETLLLETSGHFVQVESEDLTWPIAKESFAVNGCLPRPLADRRLASFDLDIPREFDLNTVGDLMTVREEVALRWLGPEKLRHIRKDAFTAFQPRRPEATRGMPLTQLPLPPSILQVLAHLGATTVHGALAADRARVTRLLSPGDLRTFDKVVRTAKAANTRELALPSSGRPENVLDHPFPSWVGEIPIANLDLPVTTKAILDDLKFSRVRDLKSFPAQPLLRRGLQRPALDELRQAVSKIDASSRIRVERPEIAVASPPPAIMPPPVSKPDEAMALRGLTGLDERTLDAPISHLRIPSRVLNICGGLGAKRVRDLASIPVRKMNARGLTTMGLSMLRKSIEDVRDGKAKIEKVKPIVDRRIAILNSGLIPKTLASSTIDTLGIGSHLSIQLRKINVFTVGDLASVPWSDFSAQIDRPMSQIKLIRRRLQELATSPTIHADPGQSTSKDKSSSHALPFLHDGMDDVGLDRLDIPSNVRVLLSRNGHESVAALKQVPADQLADIVKDGFPALCRGLSDFQQANAAFLEGYNPFKPETPTMGRFGPLPTLVDLIETALQDLDVRAERIVRTRLCLDDQSTLEEVAQAIGVTRERVRQIEVKSIAKIRARWLWPDLFAAFVESIYENGEVEIRNLMDLDWSVGLSEEALAAFIRTLGPVDMRSRKEKGVAVLMKADELSLKCRYDLERRFVDLDPRLGRTQAKSVLLKGLDASEADAFADKLLESWDITPALVSAKYALGKTVPAVDVILSRSADPVRRKDVEIALLAAGVSPDGDIVRALTACAVRLESGKLVTQRSLPDAKTRRRLVNCAIQVVQEIGPSTAETILKHLRKGRNPLVRNMDAGILAGAIRTDGRMSKAGRFGWAIEKNAPNMGDRMISTVCAFLTEIGRPTDIRDINAHLKKGHPDVAAVQVREGGDLVMLRPRVWALRSWPEAVKAMDPDQKVTIKKRTKAKRSKSRNRKGPSTPTAKAESLVANLSLTERHDFVSKAMMSCLDEAPPEGTTSTEAFHKLAQAGCEPKMSTLISFLNRNGIKIGESRPYRWKAKPSEPSSGAKPGKPTRSRRR